MATRFEIALHGENPVSLRAAGEEALDEIERLEAQLSLYRPGSEISHLNARAAREPVRVSPGVFALLQRAKQLHHDTAGAFDITIAPLVRCWGFLNGSGKIPSADELAEARARVGFQLVHLNAADLTVRFERDGVMLDLGAIGKGHAVERAADILREAGVANALIHGGTSTVCALGTPPDGDGWKVVVADPTTAVQEPSEKVSRALTSAATIPLKDEAMSVSAVWGKSFQVDDQTYGHVLDPRTGRPVNGAVLAAVVLSSATETDAFSTALLVLGSPGHEQLSTVRPSMRTLLITPSAGGFLTETHGLSSATKRG
jgi:thiamine biosynthesis lipoprotein